MRYIPWLFLLLFTACTLSVPSQKKDERKVKFSTQLGGWIVPDSIGIIFIKATLYNNSPDTLTYLRMDCSWADSYITDNDTFNIIKTLCFKNGPMTMRLPPYKNEDEYLQIKTKKKIQDWRNSKFRIGYNFILLDSTKDIEYNVSTLTDMKHIFWSDTVQLAQFWIVEASGSGHGKRSKS